MADVYNLCLNDNFKALKVGDTQFPLSEFVVGTGCKIAEAFAFELEKLLVAKHVSSELAKHISRQIFFRHRL